MSPLRFCVCSRASFDQMDRESMDARKHVARRDSCARTAQLAPASCSKAKIAGLPERAAKCRAVFPEDDARFTSARRASSCRTICSCWCSAATHRAVTSLSGSAKFSRGSQTGVL